MDEKTTRKILKISLMAGGALLSLLAGLLTEKEQEDRIDQKINEALLAKENTVEEAEDEES